MSISFSPYGVNSLLLKICFHHMLIFLLIHNFDYKYFEQLEMIGDVSYFIFDDDKALSKGLSSYSCNSSLSNEIILKLDENALMRKLNYDSFHEI